MTPTSRRASSPSRRIAMRRRPRRWRGRSRPRSRRRPRRPTTPRAARSSVALALDRPRGRVGVVVGDDRGPGGRRGPEARVDRRERQVEAPGKRGLAEEVGRVTGEQPTIRPLPTRVDEGLEPIDPIAVVGGFLELGGDLGRADRALRAERDEQHAREGDRGRTRGGGARRIAFRGRATPTPPSTQATAAAGAANRGRPAYPAAASTATIAIQATVPAASTRISRSGVAPRRDHRDRGRRPTAPPAAARASGPPTRPPRAAEPRSPRGRAPRRSAGLRSRAGRAPARGRAGRTRRRSASRRRRGSRRQSKERRRRRAAARPPAAAGPPRSRARAPGRLAAPGRGRSPPSTSATSRGSESPPANWRTQDVNGSKRSTTRRARRSRRRPAPRGARPVAPGRQASRKASATARPASRRERSASHSAGAASPAGESSAATSTGSGFHEGPAPVSRSRCGDLAAPDEPAQGS